MTEHTIAVRELAEFVHRSGDIDYRFTPSPTAIEGIEGHNELYRRRPETYASEYALEKLFHLGPIDLRVRGRADGYDPVEAYVEEIKTTRVSPQDIPSAVTDLHSAQARLYGGLLCEQDLALSQLDIQVCYFNIDSGDEYPQRQCHDRQQLLEFLYTAVSEYARWLELIDAEQSLRDRSIANLAFPHSDYRPGQREMAENVYKCISQRGQLLLQAPTGIGKTAAVIYPAIKALAAGKHDAFAFVTAKIVGARAAEDSLELLQGQGLHLHRLTVTAKERVCFSPGKACHGDDCPFARGYYDRLPAARREAVESHTALTRQTVEQLSRKYEICPYQLATDLLPWMDACIADIHHFYSFYAGIAARMEQRDKPWSVLVDEAHNLPDRARSMFSASLSKSALMAARREAAGKIKKSLDACNRRLLELDKADWLESDFHHLPEAPDALVYALGQFVAVMGEQQNTEAGLLQARPRLQDFYFAAIQFLRVLEDWGDDYRFELQRQPEKKQSLKLSLHCLDASRLLTRRQQLPASVTAFSATVSPAHWVSRDIGFSGSAVYLDIQSPFEPSQLPVTINTAIDTRFRQRSRSVGALAETISAWLAQEPGNVIVYFPSFAYMQQVLSVLEGRLPHRELLIQRPELGDEERSRFLNTLQRQQGVVAFCILGGVFGEGIDLPGDALTSVVIVGVGLPQFNRDTQARRDYLEVTSGQGFEFTYLYPGMQKVWQALGRVIRGPNDRGRALLIDQRYREHAYRNLLPVWWTYSESAEA